MTDPSPFDAIRARLTAIQQQLDALAVRLAGLARRVHEHDQAQRPARRIVEFTTGLLARRVAGL